MKSDGDVTRFARGVRTCGVALAGAILLPAAIACADPAPASDQPDAPAAPEAWAVHGQSTLLYQYHPGFRSRDPAGPQSLDTGRRAAETFDLTLFAGLRLWKGAEIWFNPEIDQGFGLQNTLGVAGYLSGEAYKVGHADPYYRLPRGFLRQTVNLGGEHQTVDPDANVLGGQQDANRVVVTIGKFSVVDIFDTNKYAHDPRADFMNWSIIDSGAFDYAADSWGFTYGATAEWYQDWWTIRTGLFTMSETPNSKVLTLRPGQQTEAVIELEERHTILGRTGSLKLLAYANRALMAQLSTFTQLTLAGGTPTLASLRHLHTRVGGALNLEQSLAENLGMFARASIADGRYETFDFTDIDRSVAIGLSLKGARWNREEDTVAAAFVMNEVSRDRLNFFRAGGLGVLVGDGFGQPASAGGEHIFETFYSLAVRKWLNVTVDYQLVDHPAYNTDKGPVHVFGLRLHAQL